MPYLGDDYNIPRNARLLFCRILKFVFNQKDILKMIFIDFKCIFCNFNSLISTDTLKVFVFFLHNISLLSRHYYIIYVDHILWFKWENSNSNQLRVLEGIRTVIHSL